MRAWHGGGGLMKGDREFGLNRVPVELFELPDQRQIEVFLRKPAYA